MAETYCICQGEDEGLMLQCEGGDDKCRGWFHASCLKMSQEVIDKMEKYICDHCAKQTGQSTIWKLQQCTREEIEIKKEKYSDVEAIVGHRIRRQRDGNTLRFFRIKWDGYSDDEITWEPEGNLDGCYETLQRYLLDKQLPLSEIMGKVGPMDEYMKKVSVRARNTLLKRYPMLAQFFKA